MAIANDRVWTVEDVWALPEDPRHRYEVVDGELLVSPSPRPLHQRAVAELLVLLHAFAARDGNCEVLVAPSDVLVPGGHLVQPDLYITRRLSQEELRAGPQELPLPMLVIEVLSPSTARADRVVKRRLYGRMGAEYWIVDLDTRAIERWTPDAGRPEICAETLEWRPAGTEQPLHLDVPALFARILRES